MKMAGSATNGTLQMNQSQLPPEAEMNREDALNAFVAAVNLVNPEHSIIDERLTEVTPDNVEFGVTRRYYARCGPRYSHTPYENKRIVLISYSTRMTYINQITRERHLALMAHEMSHLKYNSGTDEGGGGHTDRFWDEFAFNASELRDAVRGGDTVFGTVDDTALCEAIIEDPNKSTVDRRRSTVDEVKSRVAELIGEPHMM